MPDLQPEPDTLLTPEDEVTKELQTPGSDNDTTLNAYMGGDMGDLLNDGVPGYETTGVDETDDEIGEQQLDQSTPTPTP